MFSSAFVCSLAGLCKNYSTDLHAIVWRGGGVYDSKKSPLHLSVDLDQGDESVPFGADPNKNMDVVTLNGVS